MAIDAFIKYTGGTAVTGESQDTGFPASAGWSSLQSLSFGISQTANIGTQTSGAAAGKVHFGDFTITKEVDNASPQLFGTCSSGNSFDVVTIAIRKAIGGTAASTVAYLQYQFKLVYVTSISTALASGSDMASESVSFAYGAMQIQYTPQNANGALGTANPAAWSVVKNNNTLTV